MQTSGLSKWNKIFNIILIFALTFGMLSISTRIVNADFFTYSKGVFNPIIIVKVNENEIRTYFWKAGTQVKLTIDDPINGTGVDYSETQPVIEGSNLTKDNIFKISDFELEPGQLVTLTDGINTDTVLISPINITSINNPNQNTIYGTAPSGSIVYLKVDTDKKSVNLQVKVSADGTWLINTGSDFSLVNILKITCSIMDSDKDIVYYTGPTKKPHFEANLSLNSIEGWDWQFGKTVTVKIDDPENGAGYDFSGTASMKESYFHPHFVLDLGTFKLAPDQSVTITDGTITKNHVVRALAITSVILEKDLITGTSDTKDEIHSWVLDDKGRSNKRTDSVTKGVWSSDFAHAGDQVWEVSTTDITDATKIYSKQIDEDGDATLVTQITAENLPPVANAGTDITADKGETLTLDGSASSDPEGKPLTFEWDLDNDGIFDDATGMKPTAAFADEGVYPISLRVKDDKDLTSTDSLVVTIKSEASTINLPPVAEAGAEIKADQGATITFDGSRSVDPEGKPLSFDWDFDHDGLFDDATGMKPTKVFRDTGTYLVSLRVTDSGTLTATDTTTVTIVNVAPSLSEIAFPVNPQKVKSNLLFNATFTDPGILDTFTAVWDWNDGTTSAGTIDGQIITGNHSYEKPGIYTATLTLTDKEGGMAQKSIDGVVVIAPSAASVFGIGWINSPAGSTISRPMVIGKVSFDFNASYRRSSASSPFGKTSFTIKGQGFKFVSSSYNWLVIKGKTSTLEGLGTVNGKGDYGFLLSIQDGIWYKRNSDMIRIKIWNKATGEVIYDTQPGAADDTLATTPVNGGLFTINK
jgi:PKD repeat protein